MALAINDIHLGGRLAASAEQWIKTVNLSPGGFDYCADVLAIEPDHLRAKLLQLATRPRARRVRMIPCERAHRRLAGNNYRRGLTRET